MNNPLYYVIVHRPEGSKTWTPFPAEQMLDREPGNFFASPDHAEDYIDSRLKSMNTWLPGPEKFVPLQFQIASVHLHPLSP